MIRLGSDSGAIRRNYGLVVETFHVVLLHAFAVIGLCRFRRAQARLTTKVDVVQFVLT